MGFYLRLGGLFSLQSSSSIPTRGGHSCARTPRALPLAAPCAPPGVPKRSALSVRGQPAEPSRVGRFCEGHLPRRWKVPACVNALTRKPYALLSGTMVFAAQELLRDNLSTPQNVKFAGAFPTPGSARAPLGRARRGAATVGVARTTRFFIPRRRWQPITAPDFQPNAFCHFSRSTHVDRSRIRDRVPDERGVYFREFFLEFVELTAPRSRHRQPTARCTPPRTACRRSRRTGIRLARFSKTRGSCTRGGRTGTSAPSP